MKHLLLALMVVVACGREQIPAPASIPVDPVIPVTGEKPIVAVFGAPWCSYCKSDIPRLDERLKAIRDKVDFRLYVVTGGSPQIPPTKMDAEAYGRSLHVSAGLYVDPWKWTTFNKMVGGSHSIPAAAVLSADGTVLKRFPGGQFDPVDITEAVRQAMKP